MKTLVILALLFAAAQSQPFTEGKWLVRPEPPATVLRDSTHHFDVRFYRIDLATTVLSGAFTARCRVELTPRHDNFDTFSLHIASLVCDSIRRDGNACTFTMLSQRVLVDLDRPFANGESLGIDIYYHRTAGTPLRGYYWYAKGTQSIPHAVAYSVCETDDSRYWFPCFDQPWDKAERGCQINVAVPDSFSACANGSLDSVSSSAGTKKYWWTHRYPIPTYLMCMAASKFTNWRIWHHAGAESMAVRYYVWPEDSSLAANNFSRMSDMLSFFSQDGIYGLYPFFSEKYGMVAVYPYPWGGMEHQTMTTIHRSWARNGSNNGIAHELSHQWYGDMVTCVDWRNIWLNEGFATYSDELYEYHMNGRTSFLNLITSRADDYFQEEASDPHPIYNPPSGHEFDWGHSYVKGGWVQHMLRYVEGDTTWPATGVFFAGLRQYGESLAYRNANTDDYQRIMERTSGLDLDWFFNEWVYAQGYPNYTCGWQGRQTQDAWEVTINLSQSNANGAPAVFHMPVEVRVQFATGDTYIRYPVTTSPQRNTFPVRAQPTAVTFDPNEWILDEHNVMVGIEDRPATVLRLSLGPNPVRTAARLQVTGGPAALGIFDATGRCVRTFPVSGAQVVVWDRLDQKGRRVPAGVYAVRLTGKSGTDTAKLVLTE